MATYVRNKGFGVEIIDAEAECLGAAANGPALPRSQAHAGRRGGLRAPAFGLDADHAGRRRGMHGAEGAGSRPEGAAGRRARRRAARADAPGRSCRFRGRRRRARHADRVAGRAQGRRRRPGKGSDLYYRDGNRVVAPTKRAPLVQNLDEQMPGVAWDLLPMDKYRAHNWHCLGDVNQAGELVRSPYVAIYTTLGCPFKCTFCCIQAPFKSGEQESGHAGDHEQLPLLEPEARRRHLAARRGTLRRPAREIRRRNVRAQPEARLANLRPDRRAGAGPQHLGLCPGRHGAARRCSNR